MRGSAASVAAKPVEQPGEAVDGARREEVDELLGVVIGTLVPRELEGSIVLVFLADMDNALSSGLFPVAGGIDLPVIGEVTPPEFLPLYHPHALFTNSVLDGELTTGHVGPSLAWVAGLVVVAFVAYGRSTGDGWAGLAGRVGR